MIRKLKAILRLINWRKIRKINKREILQQYILLKECLDYMNKWDDKPMSELLDHLCKTMDIQKSIASKKMFTDILINSNKENLEHYAKNLVDSKRRYTKV